MTANAVVPDDCLKNRQQTAAGDPVAVLNGIDVLERDGFKALAGMKIGLITNQTGVNRDRRSTIDLLSKAGNVELKVLFSPEHGIRGVLEEEVHRRRARRRDRAARLQPLPNPKIASRPSPRWRDSTPSFSTFRISAAASTPTSRRWVWQWKRRRKRDLKIIVLDRVNPIGGIIVDGPVRKGEGNDFVAFHEIPVQHGMTDRRTGEMFNDERKGRGRSDGHPGGGLESLDAF